MQKGRDVGRGEPVGQILRNILQSKFVIFKALFVQSGMVRTGGNLLVHGEQPERDRIHEKIGVTFRVRL